MGKGEWKTNYTVYINDHRKLEEHGGQKLLHTREEHSLNLICVLSL